MFDLSGISVTNLDSPSHRVVPVSGFSSSSLLKTLPQSAKSVTSDSIATIAHVNSNLSASEYRTSVSSANLLNPDLNNSVSPSVNILGTAAQNQVSLRATSPHIGEIILTSLEAANHLSDDTHGQMDVEPCLAGVPLDIAGWDVGLSPHPVSDFTTSDKQSLSGKYSTPGMVATFSCSQPVIPQDGICLGSTISDDANFCLSNLSSINYSTPKRAVTVQTTLQNHPVAMHRQSDTSINGPTPPAGNSFVKPNVAVASASGKCMHA